MTVLASSSTIAALLILFSSLILPTSASFDLIPRASSTPKKYQLLTPPLDTPWTKSVGVDPWPDYPRPQLSREFPDSPSTWKNLNGIWSFHSSNSSSLKDPRNPTDIPADGDFKREILVPFCQESALSGIGQRANYSWFKREFETPKEVGKGGRTLINFGAVDWEATVFVNGHKAGFHRGGYTRFSVDATDFLKASGKGSNVLAVYAFDPTDSDPQHYNQPIGKQTSNPSHIFYTPCSGIWQTVWLETVPKTYISDVALFADMKGNIEGTITTTTGKSEEVGSKNQTSSSSSSSRHSTATAASHSARAAHAHGQGNGHSHRAHHHQVPLQLQSSTQEKVTITVSDNSQVISTSTSAITGKKFSFNVGKNVSLWSPESPKLYTVMVKTEEDEVESYVGFRTVEKGDVNGVSRPLLNGEFVFQFGPLDQGYWPDGIYTAPTREAMEFDLHTLKKLGMNMLRKHIKVEPDLFYYACDKMGLLVWQDAPSMNSNGAIVPTTDAQAEFERELYEMVRLHLSHPSIVVWVIYNEGWGQLPSGPETYIAPNIRKIDSSRLINAATGWFSHGAGDMSDNHHYSSPQCGTPFFSLQSPSYDKQKIGVQGEFGGVGQNLSAEHLWKVPEAVDSITQTYELDADQTVWNYRALRVIEELREQTELFSCSAGVYTQTTDVEGEVNGFLSYDRRVLRPFVDDWNTLLGRLYATAKLRAGGPPPESLRDFIDDLAAGNGTSKIPAGMGAIDVNSMIPKRDVFGMNDHF